MPNEGNRNEMKSMKILNVARNEKLIEGRKISLKKTMISRQSKEEKKNNNKCESKEEEKKNTNKVYEKRYTVFMSIQNNTACVHKKMRTFM